MNLTTEFHPSEWSTDPVLSQVARLAAEVAARESCRLYDLEITGSPQGKVVRVYIDHPERTVGIEDCSNVSKGLNAILDEQDPIPGGAYSLEVSSPGVDRHLKFPWHFQTAVGKEVKLKLSRSLGELGVTNPHLQLQKQVKEVLKSCDDVSLTFDIEGEEVRIPIQTVQKAQIVFTFGTEKSNSRGGHKKRGK